MRPRNAAGTREAILEAARAAFTAHGFDQVGVREITGAVGVNGSLVNRYFGSKEQLFAEAMQVGLGFDRREFGTFDQAITRLTEQALELGLERSSFDPVLALIRSASIEKAHPVLREYLTREAVVPLADLIGGEDAPERASLIVAFLVGIIILRGIIKSDPLASSQRNNLAELVESILRAAAFGDAAAPLEPCT